MVCAHAIGILGLGPWEILLIVAIILLLFGGARIPELARSLGKGVDEFKKGIQGKSNEPGGSVDEEEKPKSLEDKSDS